jgi:hypothetical protein
MSYDEFLEENYQKIVDKIIPSGSVAYLYGKKIDPENPKELLVAAYYVGKQEETEKHIVEWEFLNSL